MQAAPHIRISHGPNVRCKCSWRYPEAFIGSRWIWTINLVFDNTVLLRKTVR
jgi:hypothetical protein